MHTFTRGCAIGALLFCGGLILAITARVGTRAYHMSDIYGAVQVMLGALFAFGLFALAAGVIKGEAR